MSSTEPKKIMPEALRPRKAIGRKALDSLFRKTPNMNTYARMTLLAYANTMSYGDDTNWTYQGQEKLREYSGMGLDALNDYTKALLEDGYLILVKTENLGNNKKRKYYCVAEGTLKHPLLTRKKASAPGNLVPGAKAIAAKKKKSLDTTQRLESMDTTQRLEGENENKSMGTTQRPAMGTTQNRPLGGTETNIPLEDPLEYDASGEPRSASAAPHERVKTKTEDKSKDRASAGASAKDPSNSGVSQKAKNNELPLNSENDAPSLNSIQGEQVYGYHPETRESAAPTDDNTVSGPGERQSQNGTDKDKDATADANDKTYWEARARQEDVWEDYDEEVFWSSPKEAFEGALAKKTSQPKKVVVPEAPKQDKWELEDWEDDDDDTWL